MNNRTDIFIPTVGGMRTGHGYINPTTNQTFLDPNFEQRIPVGTVVNTNDGQFIMTTNGGIRHVPQAGQSFASGMSGFNSHAGNMRNLQNSALTSAIRQNNSATDMAIRDYQNMAHAINQSAEEQARAAYIQRLRSKNTLPRLLRSQGITGGAAESTTARMSSNFDNLQFGIMENRENALLDIQNRQVAARSRGRQNEDNIRQQHALNQMELEQNLHNQQLQAVQLERADFDSRRNEMITTLSQFGNDFQAQINYLTAHGDPYNLIPHLQVLRNEKIVGLETEQQSRLNEWITNVSDFPASAIYDIMQERLHQLDFVSLSALRSAYYIALERERQITNNQAAHESNISTQELNRLVNELMLPGQLEAQRANNAGAWALVNQRNASANNSNALAAQRWGRLP